MQAIQRTSCPDRQQSPAAYLAEMIDKRVRDRCPSTAGATRQSRSDGSGTQPLNVSVLIWVENEAELVCEPVFGRHRGMMIVAHGSGHGATMGSFIISYPLGKEDRSQHAPAMAGVLEAMGWSVLASRRGGTDDGPVNFAVLTSTVGVGTEQRLWLAERVGLALGQTASTDRPTASSRAGSTQ